jgi:hypothetical protein
VGAGDARSAERTVGGAGSTQGAWLAGASAKQAPGGCGCWRRGAGTRAGLGAMQSRRGAERARASGPERLVAARAQTPGKRRCWLSSAVQVAVFYVGELQCEGEIGGQEVQPGGP